MSDSLPYLRSPEMMRTDDTALVVVDVQQKLVSLVPDFARIEWNIGRLVDGAKLLGVPVLGTEQYPKGLGATVPSIVERTGPLMAKITFSCLGCEPFLQALAALNVTKVLLCGIETHVCIAQTSLDLLAAGYRVYLAVDAIGARFEIDHQTALRRLENSGATPTTTEAALFEWCTVAGTPQFKQLSSLVKQPMPGKSRVGF